MAENIGQPGGKQGGGSHQEEMTSPKTVIFLGKMAMAVLPALYTIDLDLLKDITEY